MLNEAAKCKLEFKNIATEGNQLTKTAAWNYFKGLLTNKK